ncbi:hypothetical protein DC366_03870 [Pelagivirga sediminicola]|uniref:DUF3313 domain-containing protein n=1 Tax=Pelagivirga sediminicola TaxID=2170575 RepID=A0A2T7G934_9RHOB|nr:hypothetical protein [Pelagivirga sediminicola]PVA10934.1 hypothetical protein DC366_03870 [Pelagivirga sediminicola]
MLRLIAFFSALLTVAACTNPNDLDKAPVPLGDFKLAHNVVVAPNLTKGPASRDASKEEWIASMKKAVDERFSRYDGDKLYHLGVSIEGYVLAVPGVPIVASPKSALILNATVWDDAAGKKLNEKPEQITVIESFSGETVLGSGLTQSKEEQMTNLSRNAAKLIQNWLERQKYQEDWFGGRAADKTPARKPPAARPAAAAQPAAARGAAKAGAKVAG